MTDEMELMLQGLRREYLAEAPARLGELRKDLAAVQAGEPEAAASLKGRFHKLAGSGGSYGFDEISTASREAERWLVEHPSVDDAGIARLAGVIGRIAAAFDAAARDCAGSDGVARPASFGWRALLLGGASDLAARLTFSLRDARYTVGAAPIEATPEAVPVSERPDVVVIIPAPQEDPASAVERWTAGVRDGCPAVALVSDAPAVDLLADPWQRLDLLASPRWADPEVARWVRAVARAATPPSSVLVAGGDSAEREDIERWLSAAGLTVTLAATAQEASDRLQREHPDLIVMSLTLPDAPGAALIRLVRRSGRHALVPVVAIAAEGGDPCRNEALEAGADDLLPRPVTRERLLPAVVHRVARARRSEDAVRRDPLTGFLTVGSLLDESESVLAQARRQGERLSFVVFDVDHLRRVNEQLGYSAGDAVLQHLARSIHARVRLSDLMIRMGGEEFGVLLRRCGTADAVALTEKIRGEVIASPPVIEGMPLPVNISAGVAGYPEHAVGMRELVLAAERALRQAKETGRNRVVVSSHA